MADHATILAILQFVGTAARAVCNELDKAFNLDHEVGHALKGLRKGVESLKSDTMVYMALLSAMEIGAYLDESSPYTRFTQLPVGKEAMNSLERTLQATRLLLDHNPANPSHEAMINSSGSKKPRKALNFVLNVLETNFQPEYRHKFIGWFKDATYEIFVCQQHNECAFKAVWYLYVVSQQWIGGPSSVGDIADIQDRVGQAFDSVLHAFHDHPFAVSPEGDSRVNLPTFAILNHDQDTATRHEELARRIGKAWVNDRVRRYNAQGRDIGALQTPLFELLWSGTVEQLKRHSAYCFDDPERPEFEKAVEELEVALKEGIIRSKKQRFVIAFCGMVKAGKSMFLNALMGRAILPSDELSSTEWPCRLRHVEGQKVPELHFYADPFLSALNKLQSHQYGQKMQSYKPPSENILLSDGLSDAPSEPSEEEAKLRKIHSEWIDLHAATRSNLLKFENPHFHLPRQASGEQDVKTLLGQLNDIVQLCRQFDLKFDMSEADWPLLTVEFNSFRGHRMDGIYELIDLPGISEGFCDFKFESLIRLVVSDSSAIVPVVAFEERLHSDWKHLPDLITSEFNRRANMVVCTHLDQVSQENMDEQLKTVTETFWPRGVGDTNCVVPCSSLMGLSASDLLDRSSMTKPRFETIWDEDAVGYHCAAKILGVGDPQAAYNGFSTQQWCDKLQAELRVSGLPRAIQWLTNALPDTIVGLLQKMIILYGRKLIEARRIEAEYDAAKGRYDQALEISQAVLETWGRVETMQTQEVRLLLKQGLGRISQKACGLISQTIAKALMDCGVPLQDMAVTQSAVSGKRGFTLQFGSGDISDKLQEASSAEGRYNAVLVTETRDQAKDFLRLSQRELSSVLETLKREYTAMILDLAGTAKAKLLKVVRGIIKQAELQPHPEDWENRVGNLERPSLRIDGLAVQEIRGVINSERLSLFDRQYSIEIDTLHDRFKGEINPWIRELEEEGEKALLGTTETSFMAANDLITSVLLEREDRCKRDLEKNMPVGEERVGHLTAVYSNLLAAEGALRELLVHIGALRNE